MYFLNLLMVSFHIYLNTDFLILYTGIQLFAPSYGPFLIDSKSALYIRRMRVRCHVI